MVFFDRLKLLCDERGVSPYKACTDIGLNRAAVAKWKNGSVPNGQTLAKIAEYFGVSTDYLLEKETAPAEIGKRSVSDDEIKFALFGGDGEITDAMFDEVKNFAAFVKQREADKKKE